MDFQKLFSLIFLLEISLYQDEFVLLTAIFDALWNCLHVSYLVLIRFFDDYSCSEKDS